MSSPNLSTQGCTTNPVWEPLKETMRKLYLHDNLALKEVMKYMATELFFTAT